MSVITVHESEYISVWCNLQLSLIHHQIHRYCHSDHFRNALESGTNALIQYGCTAWLSDDRLNGPLTPEDAEWAKGHWFPKTRAGGWAYWGIVKPERVVAQLNIKQFVDLYRKLGVEVGVFSEPDAAFTWIEQVRAPVQRPGHRF